MSDNNVFNFERDIIHQGMIERVENLEPKLKIGLIEPDMDNAEQIKSFFDSQKRFVESVEIIQDGKELVQKINDECINTLVINIFSYSVLKGIDIIKEVLLLKEKTVPICILGTNVQIKYFKEVPNEWRKKFKSYCKMVIDVSPQDLNDEIKRMSISLFRCREEKILKNQLNVISTSKYIPEDEKILKLSELSEKAIKLSSDQGKDANKELMEYLIPGISEQALPVVIRKTLETSASSIETFKWVNLAIIILGIFLVLASLTLFGVTENPAFLGFGGIGLTGVIASLITAPVMSIGKTARQMVQIQICYFGYFKQIEILKSEKNDTIDDLIKKSERLEAVTNSLQKSLCEHFDSAKSHKK